VKIKKGKKYQVVESLSSVIWNLVIFATLIVLAIATIMILAVVLL
jgi:hypothetical protein